MTPEIFLPPTLCFLVAYALGAIPFGLLLTRAAGLGDVRQIGSGNIGATNVLRTGKKGLAVASQTSPAPRQSHQAAASSTPPPVATPLPPLKPSQTGKQWPMKAQNPATKPSSI